jgi:hypothetical protein
MALFVRWIIRGSTAIVEPATVRLKAFLCQSHLGFSIHVNIFHLVWVVTRWAPSGLVPSTWPGVKLFGSCRGHSKKGLIKMEKNSGVIAPQMQFLIFDWPSISHVAAALLLKTAEGRLRAPSHFTTTFIARSHAGRSVTKTPNCTASDATS